MGDSTLWKQLVQEWYPNWQQRTYFIPSVFMRKVPYEQIQVAGQSVLVPRPPVTDVAHFRKGAGKAPVLDSDIREDETQNRVLHCLRALGEHGHEVMFILSQLNFSDYLNSSVYTDAAAKFPRPLDLRTKGASAGHGDFDLLLIHRHYGLLVAELKSVGFHLSGQVVNQALPKKIARSIIQLEKSGTVLNHVVSDLSQCPRITKTLFLPNVTSTQMRDMLKDHPNLKQDLMQCLNWPHPSNPTAAADPVEAILCQDQMPDAKDPWNISEAVLQMLVDWWHRVFAFSDPAMSEETYLELLARFGGPATTVRVYGGRYTDRPGARTVGEGIFETGHSFSELCLTPAQVDLLHQMLPRVFLTGPPGTGKTLMLVLAGLRWLQNGHEVLIVSLGEQSLAASFAIQHLILQRADPAVHQKVHHRQFGDVVSREEERKEAAQELLAAAQDGSLHIILDEVNSDISSFVIDLQSNVPDLNIWAASLYHSPAPYMFIRVDLTIPLRRPPSVTREVGILLQRSGLEVSRYQTSPAPLPTDGPVPRVIVHSGNGHSGEVPVSCFQCGLAVARVLQELQIGATVEPGDVKHPPTLQYRDVFVLNGTSTYPQDEEHSVATSTAPRAFGIIGGLRQCGFPVVVVQRGDGEAIRTVALMAGPDTIVATSSDVVVGLERKVVVWVEGAGRGDEDWERLAAFSRCTAQLIWVKEGK